MRKLLVTCECGQKMQVPRSAIGKMGMCPTCGKTTRITPANTSPLTERRRGTGGMNARRATWDAGTDGPSEDAKRRFGQAVDHYYAQRYAEALAVFDALLKEFPGNPDIEHGRQQCLRAMQRPQLSGPEPTGHRLLPQGQLDRETVSRIVLDKLLNGATDAIQLQAAEIACKYLGIGGTDEAAQQDASHDGEETEPAAEDEEARADSEVAEQTGTSDSDDDDELSDRIRAFP